MSTYRNGLALSGFVIATLLVGGPKEEETKPPPPPVETDVARVVRVAAQMLPQRLKRSPQDARRLACRESGRVSDKVRIATACHNYPYLALRSHILPIA